MHRRDAGCVESDYRTAEEHRLSVAPPSNRKDECGVLRITMSREAIGAPDSPLGKNVPTPVLRCPVLSQLMRDAIGSSLLLAAHDISEGGLLLALYELTFTAQVWRKIGLQIDIASIMDSPRIDSSVFRIGGFVRSSIR